MADPILIVAALNGSRDRKVAKKLPYTPAEIAKEAKRAVEAGAGVVHVHARRDDGAQRVRPHVRRDRGRHPRARRRADLDHDAAHAPDLARAPMTALFDVLRELPELATVNVQPPAPDLPAHREEARQILEACERAGVAPEPGINTLEAIADVEALYEDGLLAQAPWLHLELGEPPAPRSTAWPARPATCCGSSTRSTARSASCAGSPTARARRRRPCARPRAALGGHIRVGLEDSALLPDGTPATSNGELVELAVALADSLGREPMEPAEARRLLRS